MRDPDGRGPMTGARLEADLRDLAGFLSVPAIADGAGAALDPARAARLRIEQAGAGAAVAGTRRHPWARLAPGAGRWTGRAGGRRLGRSTVFALVAVIVLSAVVGAIGLGVPGIRILPAPPGSAAASPTPSASTPQVSTVPATGPATPVPTIPGPPGAGLGLGDPIAVADAGSAVDFPVRLPTAPGVGAPTSAWLLDGRLSLVWPSSVALPSTAEPGIGLILSEFRGSLDPGYFAKILGQGTTVSPVTVDGVTGYWISGESHEIVYVDANGQPVFDSRRSVDDTLIWARGDVTYRLESGLGRAQSIAMANSLR
jgi:hypothetical protein